MLHRAHLGAVVAPSGTAAVALGRCVLRPWHLESLGTLVKRQAAWVNAVADGRATGRQGPMLNIVNTFSQKSCIEARTFLRSLLRHFVRKEK